MTYSWKRCRPGGRTDRQQRFYKTLRRTVIQLTKKSNKIDVLEKILSKAESKDTQQEHRVCCLTWILCHLHHLLRHYQELQYKNQQNQTCHFRKKVSKTEISKGNLQKFSSNGSREAGKTCFQTTWYSYKIMATCLTYSSPTSP